MRGLFMDAVDDLASVFAILVMLGLVGVALSAVLRFVEARLCFWSGKATK